MSDKLKELLDNLKEWINIPNNEPEYYGIWELEVDDSKELLDYINQLQQENQKLKETDRNNTGALVLLNEENKELKAKLQQRDEAIEEAISHLDCFTSDINLSKYDTLKILMHTKKILNKYKENK